ncbi:MAG: histidine phosphatase family protein [Rhodospirillaceae bacterium]
MRLLLLRHAKSSWDTPDLQDHDRPLNQRGRAAATRMGQFMAARNLQPDLILCSSAQRARETLALLLRVFDFDVTLKIDRRLYGASIAQYQKLVQETASQQTTLMIIGHNPTIETYARMLARDGTPQALQSLAEKYPTCALAVLEAAAGQWSSFDAARLSLFQLPRELEVADTGCRP